MSEPDLIPVTNLDQSRENPMIWTGEEQAQGVFLDPGETDDALALLGMPAMQTAGNTAAADRLRTGSPAARATGTIAPGRGQRALPVTMARCWTCSTSTLIPASPCWKCWARVR